MSWLVSRARLVDVGAMAIVTILVANRGEIAVRVMRTARRLGYRTVAVYSSADSQAPHVSFADEAVLVGPPAASASYLAIDKILDAARRTGADAVHPGYGFLSENAAFARACAEAGLIFIGPPSDAIELMGNKAAAKRRMLAAGVPCVPGYEGDDQSDAAFEAAARKIGFPVLVKAAGGGGGRGMRLCTRIEDLSDALRSARAEAQSAFGSDELILEKALVRARHIELQVFGDTHGNILHLGERDCSVQRRHQKVIEESPSPVVDAALRERMGQAAVEAARACGYVGAGTVEFLWEPGGFYFLEMNTRLQVEHPVTELVTGIDLVEWQIRVANGEALPSASLVMTGHAMEARLYAEDPAQGFLPQTGTVLRWSPPSEARVDHGVRQGMTVSPHYDPMIAKVIVHGADREEARRKLAHALRTTTLLGVKTNKAYLLRILEDEVFAAGDATTDFAVEAPTTSDPFIAALVVYLEGARGLCEDASFIGWRSGGPLWSTIELADGGTFQVTREQVNHYLVRSEERSVSFEVAQHDDELALMVDGVRRRIRYAIEDERVWLDDGSGATVFEDVTYRPAQVAGGAGSGILRAPLDGAVTRLFVAAGEPVSRGQLVLVLEAMKMEHRIVADVDGTVEALHVDAGVQVKTRQLLAEIRQQEQG